MRSVDLILKSTLKIDEHARQTWFSWILSLKQESHIRREQNTLIVYELSEGSSWANKVGVIFLNLMLLKQKLELTCNRNISWFHLEPNRPLEILSGYPLKMENSCSTFSANYVLHFLSLHIFLFNVPNSNV